MQAKWLCTFLFLFSLSAFATDVRFIKGDNAGNIFVGGSIDQNWILKVSADEGKTWIISDSFANPQGNSLVRSPDDGAIDSNGRIFVIGGYPNLVVRLGRQISGWSTIHQVAKVHGKSIVIDNKDNIYIVGMNQNLNWFVEKSN